MSIVTANQVRDTSLGCARRKDKQAWLALFAEDAVVEDPVGVSPLDPAGKGHRGKKAIEAFWDMIIAPSPIQFEIITSFTCGNECASLIHVQMVNENGKVVRTNPMIAIHRINDEGKLLSLRAFWDFNAMMAGG